jgi:hydrogenase/urease accessory protein HupE
MSWWVPFAFVGAALIGLVIALSLTAGRSRARAQAGELVSHHEGRQRSRYEEDNALVWNPAAFVAAAALLGLLVLIGILVEVL